MTTQKSSDMTIQTAEFGYKTLKLLPNDKNQILVNHKYRKKGYFVQSSCKPHSLWIVCR